VQIHGGNIAEIGRKYNLKEDAIIDFSSNINPLGYPRGIQALIRREGHKIVRYPDTNSTELKQEIARRLNLDEKTLLVGNGSIEFIYLIPRVFKPQCVLIPIPTFIEYEKSLLSIACKLRHIPLEEEHFRVNIDEIIKFLSGVNIVYLCNPNNPTGVLLPESEVKRLLVKAEERGVLVVVDEAFMDFADNQSVTDEVKRRKNLIVIKSLTKFFGIPGLRLGYLVSNSEIIDKMNHYKEPWTVNILAQKIGMACLKDEKFILKTKRFIDRERKYLLTELSKLKGLKPYNSSTNYLLVKIVRSGLSSDMLYEKMSRQGVVIRDCRSFRGLGDKFVRVAVKRRRENNLLIKKLKGVVERG